MYCKNCGHEIDDSATVCPDCGATVQPQNAVVPADNHKRTANGVALAAKVFIIIGMIFGCWMIIPLIVGGIALSKMSKGKPSIAMGVLVLLFCNLIGGILLLCSSEADYV